MSQSNSIRKVAIVGAGGRVGQYFVEELLKTGKHSITAITRHESTSKPPSGVEVAKVNYDDETSLVSALKGQQFLVITMDPRAPKDIHSKIFNAAVKAGVPYIMPNSYGTTIHNHTLAKENLVGEAVLDYCEEIKALGVAAIPMCCGFWYEWSLASPEPWFGFNIKERKVVFIDDGETKITSSTWRQCGRALAALLSLPIKDGKPAVQDWANTPLNVSSFLISQRDMLNSLHRVLGTADKDWTITKESAQERYEAGLSEMKRGNFLGFAKALYTRTFYKNGGGDFESECKVDVKALGLPQEELDDATKRVVEMVESGWTPFG